MKDTYITEYGKTIHTIEFNEKELNVIRTLLERSDPEWYEVRNFYDLDRNILDILEDANIISIRRGVLIIELNLAIPLINKER